VKNLAGKEGENKMGEAEKLLAEIEKKYSVDWGFSSSGLQPGSHFVPTSKGIVINPEQLQQLKKKWIKDKG